MLTKWEINLNALLAFALSCILLGAFTIQFAEKETPCPLCLLQRLGMMAVAAGALMNCRFGPRKAHYGLSLIGAVFGGFVALRQIALHVCPGWGIFGRPFWGLSLYTWSFITFASVVLYIGLLLLVFDQKAEVDEGKIFMNIWCHIAFIFTLLVALANIVTTALQCGIGPCTG